MLSNSNFTLTANKTNEAIRPGGIHFNAEFNRMPDCKMDDISKSDTFTGLFGQDLHERLCLYMYMYDQFTRSRAAILLDKNGGDITFTYKIGFRGYQGNKSYEREFTDLEEFHKFIAEHHHIPSVDDADKEFTYGDGKTNHFKNDETFQRYIQTHAKPALALNNRV